MATVTLLYFASLRESAGIDSERVRVDGGTLRALYADARSRHDLALPPERLRVAVDGAFARWDDAVVDGSEIVFIPPVSGG